MRMSPDEVPAEERPEPAKARIGGMIEVVEVETCLQRMSCVCAQGKSWEVVGGQEVEEYASDEQERIITQQTRLPCEQQKVAGESRQRAGELVAR